MIVMSTHIYGENFYSDSKQGYYWYVDDSTVKDDPIIENTEKYPPLKQDGYSYRNLWTLHPDKFHDVYQNRLKMAIQDPNEDNLIRYLEIQEAAKRKSLVFASNLRFIGQKYPKYEEDYLKSNPVVKRIRLKAIKETKIRTLSEASEEFALIVFVSRGCQFCNAQKPVLGEFKKKYTWAVKALDLKTHVQIANQYEIDMTPAIIIVEKKTGASMSISRGFINITDLENRIVNTILYFRGELTPDQYDYSRQGDLMKNLGRKN